MSLRVRVQVRGVFFACITLAFTAAAQAQDLQLPARSLSPLFTEAVASAAADTSAPSLKRDVTSTDRGVLIPLYVSFASLQMLDAHSTLRAIRAGGVEQNPLLRDVAGKPAALIAVKAGVAASTIVLVDKLRVRNRVAAIALMAAINSGYAAVVAHNYRTVR
jgi:hypothetical protein